MVHENAFFNHKKKKKYIYIYIYIYKNSKYTRCGMKYIVLVYWCRNNFDSEIAINFHRNAEHYAELQVKCIKSYFRANRTCLQVAEVLLE